MKRARVLVCLLLGFLFTTPLTGCSNVKNQLQYSLDNYMSVVEGDIPEDLRLTIYYIPPYIATRRPLGVEDLISLPITTKIVIESKELASHQAQLRKLEPSILQPVKEASYIDVRLYYVFEVGEDDKLLEVIISNIHDSVYVNGIEVEHDPVFYELIVPYLSEEDRDILGI